MFVRDRDRGVTEVVSLSSRDEPAIYATPSLAGNPTEGQLISEAWGSLEPSISADGQYVAFASRALNLVEGDTNLAWDVFVRDRKTHTTLRASVSSDGDEKSADVLLSTYESLGPDISANGRYVTFSTTAANLVKSDTNEASDVFVHDLKTSQTKRVSVGSGGLQATGNSCGASLSDSGRFVGFYSLAENLVEGDTNERWDYFVHDQQKGTTQRVSVGSGGEQTGGPQTSITGWMCSRFSDGAISGNGRFVTFTHDAPNLVPNDTVKRPTCHGLVALDTFIHDRKTGRTERVSVSSSGGQGDGHSFAVSISGDGRYVGFYSTANDIAPADTGRIQCNLAGTQGDIDSFVYDRTTGATERVSVSTDGEEAVMCEPPFGGLPGIPDLGPASDEVPLGVPIGGGAYGPSLSADGRYAAYSTCAENLVSNDTNEVQDLFVRDRGPHMGVGGFRGSPSKEPSDDQICIAPDLCIPPGAAASSRDPIGDVDRSLSGLGANLYGASLAYRPQYGDLFGAIELEYMPPVLPGISPVFHGLRFEAGGRNYEVRGASLLGGTFGLFDCTEATLCNEVADLRGGYGTTGMRVVFSLPLEAIGLADGGHLTNVEVSDVEAFSGIGTYATGAIRFLDTVELR